MAQVATMNQAQLQILDMLSFIKTPEALRDLNKVISDYFVQMADAELDRMWNEGTLNEERIESFRHLHERTPYNNRLYSEITAEKVCEMKKCSNSLYI